MENQIQTALDDLRTKMIARRLNLQHYSNDTIITIFRKLIDWISSDYLLYRKYISSLLQILEENDDLSFEILTASYISFYNELIVIKKIEKWDKSVFDNDYDISDKFENILKDAFKKNSFVRISEFNFDFSTMSKEELEGLITSIVDSLEDVAKKIHWDEDIMQTSLLQLAILRSTLNHSKDFHSFYFIVGLVLDRFASSQFFQQSRDLSEEVILASYNDKFTHLGYLAYFRSYSNNSSAISGMLYANLSLSIALGLKEPLYDKFIKDVITQSIKYFRNISFHSLVKKIYESIPGHLEFGKYERRSITHSYFLSLLISKEANLPSLIVDFLNENREDIYATGINDATPWLITLYNVRRAYPNSDFKKNGLGFYLDAFELIVPPENVKTYKAIIEGDILQIKVILREALVKLNQTRNNSDAVQDNDMAIKMANRSLDAAVKANDIEMLLLAMMVKSDYSFIFSEKSRPEIAPLVIPKQNLEAFEKVYGSGSATISILTYNTSCTYVWLMTSEGHYYQLQLKNKTFSCQELKTWNHQEFSDLLSQEYFSDIVFEDTIKTATGVRNVLSEEYENESLDYKSKFNFAELSITKIETPLLLVLDNDFAGFPHNLFLNNEKEFISLSNPVCNILSTEWYIKYNSKNNLSSEFSKAIWIPTEGGDFTINHLFASIEDTLVANKFHIENAISPGHPIAAELNILTAHGKDDIAIKQIIYPDNNPRINLSKFLGAGKVLILFVCHSGSVKSTPFKNSISTIIKEHITSGYSAVIAPFWALHIKVPPIWLPVFLKYMEDGLTIVEAVHAANLKVSERYPTIAAWACMHLYGDPHLKKDK